MVQGMVSFPVLDVCLGRSVCILKIILFFLPTAVLKAEVVCLMVWIFIYFFPACCTSFGADEEGKDVGESLFISDV